MRAIGQRTRRASFVLVTATAIGCSGAKGEEVSASGQAIGLAKAGVPVELPAALGGTTRMTQFASHSKPSVLHARGLVQPRPGSDILLAPQGKFDPVPARKKPPTPPKHAPTLPASLDISQFAVPVGNQGSYADCQSYSTGYTTAGWWLNEQGRTGNPLAPVFIYNLIMSQNDAACNASNGATVESALRLLQTTGIPTQAEYPNSACVDPTPAQRRAAAEVRIPGYQVVDLSGGAQHAIMSALATGKMPVVLSIELYNEFENANSENFLVGPPAPGSTLIGAHAVTALKYDAQGVWIENQWGTGWGHGGWAELSWDFVNGSEGGVALVFDADALAPNLVCFGAGDNCGGDSMGGDPNTLYHCAAAGDAPASSEVCADGCEVTPSGSDVCRATTAIVCAGAAPSCGGGAMGGDPNTLYQCGGAGQAPTSFAPCADGCQPSSDGDACVTPVLVCPGAIENCGGDSIAGDPNTLYDCAAQGQPPASSVVCPNGCFVTPAGSDRCN